jgi:ABC-type branched-subunit amino acid transport system substrate-binding protein
LSIAIDEINAKGGVLGKKLRAGRRDDEKQPRQGRGAGARTGAAREGRGLFGGLDTPVSIAIVPFANQSKVPFMGVWAAGTPITATAPRRTTCSACRPSTHWSTGAGRLRDEEIRRRSLA